MHKPQPLLWIIDDDPALRIILEDNFSNAGMHIVVFANAHGAWTKLTEMSNKSGLDTAEATTLTELPDVIITDIRMPMMDGLSFTEWLSNNFATIPVIVMTAHSDLQSAIDTYQRGAFEYLPKPFDLDDALAVVNKALQANENYQSKSTHLRSDINNSDELIKIKKNDISLSPQKNTAEATLKEERLRKTNKRTKKKTEIAEVKSNTVSHTYGIIGQSMAMQTVFKFIGKLAHSPITVLITGESGTGKELVAHALHQSSPRAHKPFIALNMSAIPHDLIESELFGHEKGAFTGATAERQGRFEQADGGTLFLDEIGDMPFSTQTRLLRVLASGEFFRVGGKDPIKVDVRIISATHQDLKSLINQKKFREDLYYRLNVIKLELPPLRARKEDLPLLIEHFLIKVAKELHSERKYIDDSALQIINAYNWHGNIRQLENMCRWVTVMASSEVVYVEDLPAEIINEGRLYEEYDTHRYSNNAPEKTFVADLHEPQMNTPIQSTSSVWTQQLYNEVYSYTKEHNGNILAEFLPQFERVLIDVVMSHTKGHRGEAATVLGWGRNTLTRKITQVKLDDKW